MFGVASYCLYFICIFLVLSFQGNTTITSHGSTMAEWLTAIGTLLSTLAAACAAIFASKAEQATTDAANANLASNLLNEYISEEMSSSIRLIDDYFNNNDHV